MSESSGLVILCDFPVTIMTFNGLKGTHHVNGKKCTLKKKEITLNHFVITQERASASSVTD